MAELRARLVEAEQTLEEIRAGGVDALVVSTAAGDQVFALRTADQSYRRIIESIHEGAATLTDDGTIFYANGHLASLLDAPLERLIGSNFGAWLAEDGAFESLQQALGTDGARREAMLRASSGRLVPVYLALSRLPGDEGPGLCLVVTDLTAQKRQQELLASEELSRSILEQAGELIVVCDRAGVVVRASNAAERLCGKSPLHRRFESVFGLPLPTGPVDALETLVDCGGERAATMLLSARPLLSRGERLGVVVTLTDISERKRNEEAVHRAERQAREVAEAANRAKDEFLAMLAHELRNPLFAVRNAVEVARTGAPESERAFRIATHQLDQLSRLVDDLLDVARIQGGKVELRREPLDLAAVVGRALDAARSLNDAQGHRVEAALEPGLGVQGDAARLEQVIGNLLSNAAKYTPPGGRIEVSARREGGQAVVRVRDEGVGIAPELLPHVFDLFAQGRQGLDRAAGGLGIGLTVTRRLVEMHGGNVEARSQGRGAGAEFEVRLPLAEVRRAPAPEARASETRGEPVRVLLVEDNADAAESLAMLLTLLGHQVRAVGDGPSAIAAIRDETPDVALVDIGLPGMDGYELAQRLRTFDQARIVLVAVTGYGHDNDKLRAAEAGFHAHLVKPIDLGDLERVLALPRR